MRYKIRRLTDGGTFQLLSEQESRTIVDARIKLTAALAFEEKYGLLVDNYAEWEIGLLELTVRDWMFDAERGEAFRLPDRLLLNVLSAGLLYVGGGKQNIRDIMGRKSETYKLFEATLDEGRTKESPYGLISELRNYAQHSELPITHLRVGRARYDISDTIHLSVAPFLDPDRVADSELQKRCVANLLNSKKLVDIKYLLRAYIEVIGSTHAKMRDEIRSGLQEAESIIVDVLKTYADGDVNGAGQLRLWPIEHTDRFRPFTLTTFMIDRRKDIERRYARTSKFASVIYTSESNGY